MAGLRALAFGPLPASQARAAESFGQDVSTGASPLGLPGGGGAGGVADLNAPEPMTPRASDRLAALSSGGAGTGGASTFGELGGVGNIEDLPGGADGFPIADRRGSERHSASLRAGARLRHVGGPG